MLITPDYIFLFNPRTGSRALKKALCSVEKDYTLSNKHHAPPKEVREACKEHTFRYVYAVVRNPADQMASWYQHAGGDTSRRFKNFEDFCEGYSNGYLLGNRLNIFENVPDINIEYFCYDIGLEEIVRRMTSRRVQVEHIGKSKKRNEYIITPRSLEIIQQRFPEDVQLYREVYHDERDFLLTRG
jgi:hypothetical protein